MSSEQQFLALIDSMSDKSNENRTNGENALISAASLNPQAFIFTSLSVIKSEAFTLLQRKMSVLVLKRSLCGGEGKGNIFHRLSPAEKEGLRRELLLLVAMIKEENLKALMAGMVGCLAAEILSDDSSGLGTENQWPELVPHLFELYQAGDGANIVSVFQILDPIFAATMVSMKPHVAELAKLFDSVFSTGNVRTKIVALETFVTFVQAIKRKDLKYIKKMKQLLRDFMVELISNFKDCEDELESAVGFLNDIAEVEPGYFKGDFDSWIEIVAKMRDLSTDSDSLLKTLGIELLLPVLEAFPELLASNTKRIGAITNIVVANMLEVEEEVSEEWKNPPEGFNDELEEQDDQKEIKFGISVINLLFEVVGGPEMFAFLSTYLEPFVKSEQWKYKNVAIMLLSQAGEYIRENKEYQVNIMNFVAAASKDPNPRVRYACCHLLGQFSEDLAITFQENFHKEYFGIVLPLLEDPVPRVVAHCMASLTNFLENVTNDQLLPVLEQLYSRLYSWILNGISFVKEAGLSAMSALFEGAAGLLEPKLDEVMSVVFAVLQNANGNLLKVLKGNAIECGTIICKFCSLQKTEKYAEPLILEMIKIVKVGVDFDSFDSQKSFLLTGFQRMSFAAPEKLTLHLDELVESLFRMAKLSIVETEENKASARTNASEECEMALQMLSAFIQNLSEAMVKFELHIFDLTSAIISSTTDEEIRASALDVFSSLAKLYKLTKGPSSAEVVRKIVEQIWKMIELNFNCVGITNSLQSLQKVFKYSENAFSEKELDVFFDKCKATIAASIKRKTEAVEDIAEDDDAEEANRALEDNEEVEESLQLEVAILIGTLFKSNKITAGLLFNRTLNELISPALTLPQGLQFGLFLMCDALNYLGNQIPENVIFGFVNTFLTHCKKEEMKIKQSCFFGLGVAASLLGEKFFEASSAALKEIDDIIMNSSIKTQGLGITTVIDNCISAKGKIIKAIWSQMPADILAKHLHSWLHGLPLLFDHKENILNLEMLIRILQSNPEVLLSKPENVVKTCEIFASVYKQKILSNPEIDSNIKSLITGFLSNESIKAIILATDFQICTREILQAIIQP